MPGQTKTGETYSGNLDPTATRAIFGDAFDLFGVLDETGRVVELSGSIFERASADPSLLKGQIFSQTVFWQSSENTPKVLENAIVEAAANGRANVLLDFRVSSDMKNVVDLNLLRLSESSGNIFFYAQQATDRRDRAEYYKQEIEELLFAAENADIGLWFWDLKSNKIYSTPKCNEMFGVPPYDRLSINKVLKTIHPDDRERTTETFEKANRNGTRFSDEFRVVYSDGRVDWIASEGKAFLDCDGKPEKATCVVRKITEEKIEAEELALVYDRERRARDEAVEANRAKDLFLGFVSHELRSPLNAILGWAKILLTKDVDELTRRNALETIERQARAQNKIINDLVDSTRVASGRIRLEFRPTNLFEIAKASFDAQKPGAEAAGIDFSFSADREDISVFGDSGRLQQVFENLLTNAIKFTPTGGRISMNVSSGSDTAVISVEDSGRGISEESLPKVFRQFSQVDIGNGSRGNGLGLGLSIVNTLVAKHGGTVVAHSEGLGLGSKFTITLPISANVKPTATPKPAEAKGKPLVGLNIILVEDDPDSREVLQLFLEQNGASVRSTDSAQMAINMLAGADGLPDLLISDLAMPNEDGYSLIGRVRDLPKEKGGAIPALALSAFASTESRERAVEAGFQRYSTKPFEPDHLIPNILDLVGRS